MPDPRLLTGGRHCGGGGGASHCSEHPALCGEQAWGTGLPLQGVKVLSFKSPPFLAGGL